MILPNIDYTLIMGDILQGEPVDCLDDMNETTRHRFNLWRREEPVHLFRINQGPEISQELNARFDYAAKCSHEDAEEIVEMIRKWRVNATREDYDEMTKRIEKHDNFLAFWV